jgi:hypothetical protein
MSFEDKATQSEILEYCIQVFSPKYQDHIKWLEVNGISIT